MRHLIVACTAVMWLGTARAEVQVPLASALLQWCNSSEIENRAACDSYMRGLIEFHQYFFLPENPPLFCLPDGWNAATWREPVKQWISSRLPQVGDKPAFGIAVAALAANFPCEQSSSDTQGVR